jgi:antirestriction protein
MSNLKNALVDYAEEYDIHDLDAFAAYVEYLGGIEFIERAATDFADAYQGEWRSLEDFAHDLMCDVNPDFMRALVDHNLEFEIDEIAWQQDYYITDEGYVFRTNV